MHHTDVLIIIPAKNEASTIKAVIQEIQQHVNSTILVVDDASDDKTAEIAKQAGAKVLSLIYSLGAWGAIQTGLRYAEQQNYQVAITMDADGQHEANSISHLLLPITQKKADVVVGAYPERGSFARQIAWTLFRQLSGVKLEDLTSGLRAYNRTSIELLASSSATLIDYQDMGVLMLLNKAGLHITEINTPMRPRQDGHSRIFYSWWAVGCYMMQTIILCLAQIQYRKKAKCPTN